MPTVNNIQELRVLSLRLIDDIISEKYKLSGADSDTQMLNHINKQIGNVINITSLELKYAKEKNSKVKFLDNIYIFCIMSHKGSAGPINCTDSFLVFISKPLFMPKPSKIEHCILFSCVVVRNVVSVS